MRQVAYLMMKLFIIIALFVTFFSYAMFQGGFVSWFLFYMIVPFLAYYLIFIFYPIKDWQVKRVLPEESTISGQAIRVQLELTRRIPFPISFLIVEEILPETIQPLFELDQWAKRFKQSGLIRREPMESTILYPIFFRKQHFLYQLNQLPRGVHAFKHVRLTITDLFGFMTKTITLPIESTLKVAPVNLNIQIDWSIDQKQTGDDAASIFQSNHSNNVTGAREYVSGDRLSTIHWKASAKTGALMTKEFDQEYNRDGTVMLFGFNQQMTYERNIAICYALLQVIKSQHLIVDFSYIGEELVSFPADQHWPDLTDAFIAFKPGVSEVKIAATFDHYERRFVKGQFLLLFTDQLTTNLVERLVNLSTESSSRITVYVTRSQSENNRQTDMFEAKLRSHYINVYLITEQDLKHTRGVVTI